MKSIALITLSAGVAAMLGISACNKTTSEASKSSSGGATSTAPSGQDAKIADKALVRFINATPTAKDLYFGDVTAFSNVGAEAVSTYSELPAQRHEFKLFDAGTNGGSPLATNSESPSAGQHYTVVAMNSVNGSTILDPVSDDLSAPEAGKAKVRVIHAAPGVSKVDIYPAGSKKAILDGIAFKDATSYKDVDPVVTEIDVRTEGNKESAVTIHNVTLQPGKLYTLLLMGGNGEPLTSKVIEDQLIQSVASIR
jgi:hypothetical protein